MYLAFSGFIVIIALLSVILGFINIPNEQKWEAVINIGGILAAVYSPIMLFFINELTRMV